MVFTMMTARIALKEIWGEEGIRGGNEGDLEMGKEIEGGEGNQMGKGNEGKRKINKTALFLPATWEPVPQRRRKDGCP